MADWQATVAAYWCVMSPELKRKILGMLDSVVECDRLDVQFVVLSEALAWMCMCRSVLVYVLVSAGLQPTSESCVQVAWTIRAALT